MESKWVDFHFMANYPGFKMLSAITGDKLKIAYALYLRFAETFDHWSIKNA